MNFSDFMNKVRYWDNRAARWMMRHFYLLFFEAFLILVFFFFFVQVIHVINLSADTPRDNIVAQLLLTQNILMLFIVLLLLLSSFWVLYLFNSLLRAIAVLRDINYNLIKRKPEFKNPPS